MQDSLNKNEIIEKISRRIKCATCGRRYKPYDFSIIDERETLTVIKIVCRQCHKQSVVLAQVQHRKVRSVYSELEPEDWRRLHALPPLTVDDVIVMHRRMQDYDGDFGDVLEDPLPPEAFAEP